MALVASFIAFVNVNTTDNAVTTVSNVAGATKTSQCVSASRNSMAVVVIEIALIDVVTDKAIANVPAVTLTCVATKVVSADRVDVTVVVGRGQTFIKVGTSGAVSNKTLFASAVKDARSGYVAIGIN